MIKIIENKIGFDSFFEQDIHLFRYIICLFRICFSSKAIKWLLQIKRSTAMENNIREIKEKCNVFSKCVDVDLDFQENLMAYNDDMLKIVRCCINNFVINTSLSFRPECQPDCWRTHFPLLSSFFQSSLLPFWLSCRCRRRIRPSLRSWKICWCRR